MSAAAKPFFAPQLFIPHGVTDISFYEKAFNAEMLRLFKDDDGSIHVAELSIAGTLFHLHEQTDAKARMAPGEDKGTTVMIGLFVPDVDEVMKTALAAGATLITAAQDYDYGYRQGEFKDPFGHHWMIEQKI